MVSPHWGCGLAEISLGRLKTAMTQKSWFAHLKWRHRIRSCKQELSTRQVSAQSHGLDAPLVVSLTSFPPRFPQLHLTLQCLLKQSISADETILWIAHQDMAELTPEILTLQEEGLTIRACDDLRSYKKLIPALVEDPNRYIVTADDDCYYSANWLEGLVKAHNESPDAVVSHRAHRVVLNAAGGFTSYERWTKNIGEPAEGPEIFATGVGGILYPPHALDDRATDIALFQKVCPNADDVWFYWMAQMNGRSVRHVGPKTRVLEWAGTQDVSLRSINHGREAENGNDRAIAAMVAEFGIPL